MGELIPARYQLGNCRAVKHLESHKRESNPAERKLVKLLTAGRCERLERLMMIAVKIGEVFATANQIVARMRYDATCKN